MQGTPAILVPPGLRKYEIPAQETLLVASTPGLRSMCWIAAAGQSQMHRKTGRITAEAGVVCREVMGHQAIQTQPEVVDGLQAALKFVPQPLDRRSQLGDGHLRR
jgi:hypothetical protein